MKRTATILVAALALAFAAGAYAQLGGARQARAKVRPGLKVRGQVAGLFPGARVPLALRVRSGFPFEVRVMQVTATVRNAAPGCARGNLSVNPFHGSLRLPPHRTRRVVLRVSMSTRAPGACQGASFPLHYLVTARR